MNDREETDKISQKLNLLELGIFALGIKDEISPITKDKIVLEEKKKEIILIARENHELIRRACSLLEQINELHEFNNYYGIIKDYLAKFKAKFTAKLGAEISVPPDKMNSLALKILLDLLFFSAPAGDRFLELKLKETGSSRLSQIN